MTSITKTHPSLELTYCNVDIVCGGEILVKRTNYYDEENIKKHTIDKDVILDIVCRLPLSLLDNNTPVDCSNWLLKELGLDGK